jgi:branched-subunit amino acid aminotransferase/4-amino-4-deoxychorismate lyase
MRICEGAAQAVFIRWGDDHVDMIGHQAITPDFSMGLLRGLAQQILVKRIVALIKKHL